MISHISGPNGDDKWHFLDNDLHRNIEQQFKSTNFSSISYQGYQIAAWMKSLLAINDMDNKDYIDIGTNYGNFVLPLSNLFNEVHCFEIDSDLREALKLNAEQKDNIVIYDCGLGSSEAEVRFHYHRPTGTSHVCDVEYMTEENDRCRWHQHHKFGYEKIKTLDSFNFNNVGFIKIDVEGYEIEVLKGSINTIEKNRPVFWIEFNPKRSMDQVEIDRRNMFKMFNDLDYYVFDVRRLDVCFIPREYS